MAAARVLAFLAIFLVSSIEGTISSNFQVFAKKINSNIFSIKVVFHQVCKSCFDGDLVGFLEYHQIENTNPKNKL